MRRGGAKRHAQGVAIVRRRNAPVKTHPCQPKQPSALPVANSRVLTVIARVERRCRVTFRGSF